MTDPIRAALERLVAADSFIGEAGPEYQQARDAARAALAAPTPPADGEAEELVWRLGWIAAQCADIGWSDDSATVNRAAALLREARPQPVPVAERPWERPNWCDSGGRCWWLTMDQSWPCIYLMKPNSTLATDSATYALPHWAILIPSPTESTNGSTN